MSILNNSISYIFSLILIAVILVVLFSFLKSFIPLLLRQFKIKTNKSKQWVYAIEAILLVVVLLVFISLSISKNTVVSIVLLSILIFVLYYFSQYLIKDYLAGLFIKSSKEYQIGDQITLGELKGRIDSFTKTQLKIKSVQGGNIYIPFSKFISQTKQLERAIEEVNTHTFEFQLLKNKSFEEDFESLRNYIQLLPWIHPSQQIIIETIEEREKEYLLEITVFAYDKKYYRKIEQAVENYC